VGKSVKVGDVSFNVERVELGWDSAAVLWQRRVGVKDARDEVKTGGQARALLLADGVELEGLPDQAGSRLSEPRDPDVRRTVSYPLMRSARSLRLVMRLPSGEYSEPLTLQVP